MRRRDRSATGMSVCGHDPDNTAWSEHPFYNVPDFHRVVHGSTFPLEWLKLTVDPDAHYKTNATTFGPFAWQRMPQPPDPIVLASDTGLTR